MGRATAAGAGIGRQRGQAAVELVAVLPAVVVLALAGWMAVRAAHEWMVAASAARAAVRAQEVGAPGSAAARAVLGPARAARATITAGVDRAGAPRVTVTVRPGAGRPRPPATRATATAATGAAGAGR